ncbi:hypothetical protein LEN26_008629 [Aphanomyces euteiches]|nr:hypothetical protein LEN26_008629 [Aphanomyces euteiches]
MQAVVTGVKRYANTVKAVFVGNEDLMNGVDPDFVIAKVQEMKQLLRNAGFPNIPVGSVQTDGSWGGNLASKCDILGVNIHPFFSGAMSRTQPIEDLKSRWNQMVNWFPGKKIMLTETGWPTAGSAYDGHQPSLATTKDYLNKVQDWARQGNGGDMPAFFVYNDTPYKSPDFEQHFGLSSNGVWKFDFNFSPSPPPPPPSPLPSPTPPTQKPTPPPTKPPTRAPTPPPTTLKPTQAPTRPPTQSPTPSPTFTTTRTPKPFPTFTPRGTPTPSPTSDVPTPPSEAPSPSPPITRPDTPKPLPSYTPSSSPKPEPRQNGTFTNSNNGLPVVLAAVPRRNTVVPRLRWGNNDWVDDKWALWSIQRDLIVNVANDKCLAANEPMNGGFIRLVKCDANNHNQRWTYDASTQQLRHLTHTGFCLDLNFPMKSRPFVWQCREPSDADAKVGLQKLEWWTALVDNVGEYER